MGGTAHEMRCVGIFVKHLTEGFCAWGRRGLWVCLRGSVWHHREIGVLIVAVFFISQCWLAPPSARKGVGFDLGLTQIAGGHRLADIRKQLGNDKEQTAQRDAVARVFAKGRVVFE